MQTLNKSPTIKLNRLMSLILHFFKRSHSLFTKVHQNEFNVNIHYKKANEKFTEADWILQKMFENYLSKYFPEILIIGEEDTSDDLIIESEFFAIENENEINFDLIKDSDLPENIREIQHRDLALYIDPIDSTEQFIKRNFGPVTSLVGLTRKSQPFIGFIYFPMYLGKEDNSKVFINIPTRGVFEYNTETDEISSVEVNKVDNDKWVFISSGSRTTDNMKNFYKTFGNSELRQIHGLGTKSLECVLYDNIFLASGKNLGLWDVCAGHCLVKEIGGGLYYLDGSEVAYTQEKTTRNLDGVCFMTSQENRVKRFLENYYKSNINLD